jgi:glucose 1-dehydrogenase
MGTLQNRIAVITGGSRGFGLSVAEAFVRESACVAVASRSSDSIRQATDHILKLGGEAIGFTCDVGDPDHVSALADKTIQHFGRFDIWINNAGISAPYGPTADNTIEAFRKVVDTNILGVYYGSITAVRHYLSQNASDRPFQGKLINILGRGANRRVPMQNAYAASKAWNRNFTLAMAEEYKKEKFGIYAYNPGLMYTDMMEEVDVIEGYEHKVRPLQLVMRLWAKPTHVPAKKMVWLASSATDGRTGLDMKELGTANMIKGLIREGLRRATRRSPSEWDFEVNSIPPAVEK